MSRVEGIVSLHDKLHGKRGRPPLAVSDTLRGALVLAFAALDALTTDLLAAAVPEMARRGQLGNRVERWAKENPERVLECLTSTDSGAHLATVLEEDLLGKLTFQRAERIEAGLRDIIGCQLDWSAVAERLNGDDRIEGHQWSAEDVKRHLNKYADRRNAIAHEGDLKPGKSSAMPIRRDYVEEAALLIEHVGEQIYVAIRSTARHGL